MNCVTRYQSGHTFTECTGGNAWLIPVYIIFGLFIIYICIKILRKIFSFNNFNSNLLEEYVVWHQNNKDDSASIGNSYASNNFLIIKDRIGNIIDEVQLDTARFRCYPNKYSNEENETAYNDLEDFLIAYIAFYNKNNQEKADQEKSGIKGDEFILRNSKCDVIKTIDMYSANDELTR